MPKIIEIIVENWESPRTADSICVRFDAPATDRELGPCVLRSGLLLMEFTAMPGNGRAYVEQFFPDIPLTLVYPNREENK